MGPRGLRSPCKTATGAARHGTAGTTRVFLARTITGQWIQARRRQTQRSPVGEIALRETAETSTGEEQPAHSEFAAAHVRR